MANPYFIGGGAMVPQPPPLPPMMPPPGVQGILDPAANNQPLDFNLKKGKPPMPIPGSMDKDERMMNMVPMDKKDEMVRGNASGQVIQTSNMGAAMQMGPMGAWGPMMGPMGVGDPNMMMQPMGAFNQMNQFGFMPGMPGTEAPPVRQKEVITLKSSTLYPPPPNAQLPPVREQPPGCRTIFVGGLPENLSEEMLREIFENCGPISSVRMSKKNFAHIRFDMEESVEKALYLSGYRIKIGNNDDKLNTGRVHVDYAQARDDLYEWECKQRLLAREQRHHMRVQEERLRPPSPPPIIHFSDHEASVILEKLKGDESFLKATQVLITWLDRGDCNRRTANTFYSMVQSVNSHIRRLLTEKTQHDDEFAALKLKFRQRLEGILRQFEQIDRVFTSAGKQKCWDHFSKAQRKNLESWRTQCQDIRAIQEEEFFKEREEAEMEMASDTEDENSAPAPKKKREDMQAAAAEWLQQGQMKEENDTLRCQLEAYKNEVDLLKQETSDTAKEKDKQIKALQQALQGMQQQLISAKEDVLNLQSQVDSNEDNGTAEIVLVKPPVVKPQTKTRTPEVEELNARQAHLIGVISTFLHVHPFGATVDYIWSYLQRLNIQIRSSEIEDLLEKLPQVFKRDLHGVGASIEKLWRFVGFEAEAISSLAT